MKFKTPLLLCLLMFCRTITAQNLIANPEFKDVNICCENNANCSFEGWFTLSTSQPTALSGHFIAGPYVALDLANEKELLSASCMATPLLCNMRKGESYEITLVVEPHAMLLSRIEVIFSDTMSLHLANKPEVSATFRGNWKNNLIYDKRSNLITLVQTYVANGNERYMMIGWFSNEEEMKWKRIKKRSTIAYHLHGVSVTPVNHQLDCDFAKMKELVYNENRRHDFGYQCSEKNTNLFPHLLVNTVKVKNEYVDPRIKRFADAKKANEKPIDNVLRNLNFETGKSVLTLAAYNEVSRLVVILHNKKDKKVKLVGYTDNQGNDAQNLKLSIDRAKAVYAFLVSKGINPNRITFEGKGAADPIDSNDTETGRSNNRRVEFFLSD